MTDQLLFEVQDRIATITLNRPEKMNAFTTEMLHAWADALHECARRDDVHVVVLTGAGKGFCSGGDVGNIKDRTEDSAYARKKALAERVHRIPLILETFDKPVIVAVNGVATGAGMDMALMGDIRIAARSARFAETYVRIGIFAGDGGTWYLPRIVGMPKALELFWTARFVDAEEAERLGIVNKVVDDAELMKSTYEMAAQIAAQPPIAVQMMKRAAYQGARMDLRTHLDMASSHMAAIYSTADHKEAIAAFQEKRKGSFFGR
ncbi:enoyl-CoA hydratase/isomerase family protein [Noviherbaspirillum sp. Root189]|uniref:enoyl-CoA hydratase/isomerase family protein n=1 Tax=Noviherbaspirillum sp. Root189 TaxID=1736487 RepID=UPI00070F6D4E|nr:enoyl-CoA hydratase-related protein [Noviherbaspirillum sp. Root189]KRB75746.1 enoyl-CoA hydratase [Noviherbaspirillum sp. Root189]